MRLTHPAAKGREEDKAEVRTHLGYLLDALETVLHGANKRRQTVVTLLRLDPKEDPFLKRQASIDASKSKKMPDAIEVLFRRANAGGTILAGEEMAYSLLKARWDGAYPLVDRVVQDKGVGYILPPSGLVLAAARLALSQTLGMDGKPRRDVAQPSVGDFRRWIGEPGAGSNEDGPFLRAMKALLQPPDAARGDARFHAALVRLCKLVLYREESYSPPDPGLPRSLLLSINPLMLHPVLRWLDNRRNDDDLAVEKSREPLLRYLVFSLLGLLDPTKASLWAMNVVQDQDHSKFPDRLIYQGWRNPDQDRYGRALDPVVLPLLTIEQLAAPFSESVDGLLRDWNALFGSDEDSHRVFRRRFWTAEGSCRRYRVLLLWFQRQYLPRWFKGYNPMREDGADKPYDEDHILAGAHLIKQGSTPSTPDLDPDGQRDFNNRRWLYLHSLGNLRIWPLWANRADGKDALAKKLRLDSTDSAGDSVAAELGLSGGDDFLIASSIDLANRQHWLDASDDPFKWPEKRRVAWQTAVERRTTWLYRTLYDTLSYSNWE